MIHGFSQFFFPLEIVPSEIDRQTETQDSPIQSCAPLQIDWGLSKGNVADRDSLGGRPTPTAVLAG